jgi:hypothetical protein
MADATGTQAARLPDIAASADVSLYLVESQSLHAAGSLGVAGEPPAFQSHPPFMRRSRLCFRRAFLRVAMQTGEQITHTEISEDHE